MGITRIVYRDWMAAQGFDPGRRGVGEWAQVWDDSPRTEVIREAVTEALGALDDEEREFIERFYFMGQSYRELAELTGRSWHKLEALHRRAMTKLRARLAGVVEKHYGIRTPRKAGCPICDSVHRVEIDEIVRGRDREATWRPVMRRLKEEYGITIRSPQTLTSHEKYHRRESKEDV